MSPRRSLTVSVALALAICAMCAPVAASEALAPPDSREQDAPRAGTTIVRVSDRGGFDWGDAGIGAVGGIAISLLGVGLVLLLSMNRQPQGADTQ